MLDDRGQVEAECRVLLPDGTVRIMAAFLQLEDAADGSRTQVVGTVRDVTDARLESERKGAELEFIQTMMDAIPIPVYQNDPAGRFQACNAAWSAFTGWSRQSLIGRTIEEMNPVGDISAIGRQDRRLLMAQDTSSIDIGLTNAAGEMRQLHVHKASYVDRDGRIAGLVGVAFDVTEEKANKARLEQMVTELDRRNQLAELLSDFGEVLQQPPLHERAARPGASACRAFGRDDLRDPARYRPLQALQ